MSVASRRPVRLGPGGISDALSMSGVFPLFVALLPLLGILSNIVAGILLLPRIQKEKARKRGRSTNLEEGVPYPPLLEYLHSKKGHELAGRIIAILEDVKKATEAMQKIQLMVRQLGIQD